MSRAGIPDLALREQHDEVLALLEDEVEGERVEADILVPAGDLEAGAAEDAQPVVLALVVVDEVDAVRAVTHPVHEAQEEEVQAVGPDVVLDDDIALAHP